MKKGVSLRSSSYAEEAQLLHNSGSKFPNAGNKKVAEPSLARNAQPRGEEVVERSLLCMPP
jgi:hypothetical protein